MKNRGCKSVALTAYLTKVAAAQAMLAKHFVAFVRPPQSEHDVIGYVVTATDGSPGTVHFENFSIFYASPSGAHFRDIESVIKAAFRESRELYSPGGKDFHAPAALTALGAYCRYILEDAREPLGLPVLCLGASRSGDVRLVEFTGEIGEEISVNGPSAVFMLGCYDADVKAQVRDILQRELAEMPADKVSQKRLSRAIKKVTDTSAVTIAEMHR